MASEEKNRRARAGKARGGAKGRRGPGAVRRTGGRVLHRQMGAMSAGGLRVLDTIRWDDGGTTRIAAFFGRGTPTDLLSGGGAAGATVLPTEQSGMLGGQRVTGQLAAGAQNVVLQTVKGALELPAAAAETALFAGRDVFVTLWQGEPAEIVADWLSWHCRTQGLQGAVLICRAAPGRNVAAFAAELDRQLDEKREISADFRVVAFECPVPLGDPQQCDATHPFHAADAPGKDRMELPPPDAWLSPLKEGIVFEIARARFLGRAAAVANPDLSDLLCPMPEGGSVFAAVRALPEAVMMLIGRRIYPWRVRNPGRPGFGEHVCLQFDAASGNRKWCVDNGRIGPGAVWRAVRIGGHAASERTMGRFWRAMNIRHPQATVSELVPKTSLIEDETLLATLPPAFGAKPIRAPRSRPSGRETARENRTAIVTTMKNEGPFILEWLAYHRMIGVQDFLIYTNDCTDGTDELLDLLQDKGLVQHRENPFRKTGLKPQHAALQAAESEPVIRDADWAICMDVDEFIAIHTGAGKLADLFAAIGDANMISLTWRLFGNSDIHEYRDRFLIEQFVRCAPEVVRKPHQAWGFKTLFRNRGYYKKLGVHRPKGLRPDLHDQIRWVNGSGKPMPRGMLRNGWRSTLSTYGYGLVTLNHYAVRSAESFLVKRDRGRVNHVDRDQGLHYWFRMNFNVEEDRSIQRMIPELQKEHDRLMADPEIAAAHALCVERHREKIAELRARPDYAAFYEELISPRMERLSRLLPHFGSAVFFAGPGAVPDEVVFAETLPPDFFFTVRQPQEHAEGH